MGVDRDPALRRPFRSRCVQPRGVPGDPAARACVTGGSRRRGGRRTGPGDHRQRAERGRGGPRASAERRVGADLLLVDAGGFQVRHDLLRGAMYEALPPGRRRDLHARVARVLARRGVEPAELARHWYGAGVVDEAARASLAAARQAEHDHAPSAAHRHLERVLELWPLLAPEVRALTPGRADLMRRAAAAAERAGSFARATCSLSSWSGRTWTTRTSRRAGGPDSRRTGSARATDMGALAPSSTLYSCCPGSAIRWSAPTSSPATPGSWG